MSEWKLLVKAPYRAVKRLRWAIDAARRDVRRYKGASLEEQAASELQSLPELEEEGLYER